MEDKEFENKILNTIMVKQQMLINDIFNMINEKYIEKSKVKEKIEHLKNFKGLTMYEKCRYDVVINHLQELMEDE